MTWSRGRVIACGAAAVSVLAAWLVPLASDATTPPLACGEASIPTPWQSTVIPPFPGVQNVTTADKVTTYGVDGLSPSRVVVTNGTTIQASVTAGCTWSNVFTLEATPANAGSPSGVTSHIVATTLLASGRGVMAVQEGNGSASRPRVLSSPDGAGGGYAPTESGLPQQGVPGVLAPARDGMTVFLTVQPVAASGTGPIPLPLPTPLPTPLPGSSSSPVAGLVYASTDGGVTWTQRTSSADAAAAGTRTFTQLVVSANSNNVLFAIASGKLLRSNDGGASFTDISPNGAGSLLSIATSPNGFVLVGGTDGGFLSADGKHFFKAPWLPTDVTAVAFRDDGASTAIESGGQVEVGGPLGQSLHAPTADNPGTLVGDYGPQATFHAVEGHRLLRFSDLTATGGTVGPTIKVKGDVPPAPPRNGVVTPSGLTVTLPPGGSKTLHYTLALPDDPTPLNVFYLVDISSTLTDYQDDLKRNIKKISQALAAKRISLRVGIGTIGTGPSDGRPPYPDTSTSADGSSTPTASYHKPTLYHLLRRLGPADNGFYQAVSEVQTETLPYPFVYGDKNNDAEEGQLLSLEQAATGGGVLSPQSTSALPQYAVPGGQEAGFVPDPFVRNVMVMATDEYFANPSGSPRNPDGSLAFDRVVGELKALRIQQLGLTIGTGADEPTGSFHDLARIATGTGAIAPPGGIKCSDNEQIAAGSPIVCTQPDNFSKLLVSVLSGLRDLQTLTLKSSGNPLAITATSATALTAVDVTKAHALPFTVTYSCAGLAAGSYPTKVDGLLRGYVVGTAAATVNCLAGAVAPIVLPVPPIRPLLRVIPPPPPPPPPAPPQVPPQGQVQSQVNPVSAAALQEEQQLQLALATNSLVPPEPDQIELAMVDRRRRQEHSALMLLVAAMAAASVGGVVRLRVRTDPTVARAG